jgi:hypothetical protein
MGQKESDVRRVKDKLYAIGGIPSKSIEISISGSSGGGGGGGSSPGEISTLSLTQEFSASASEDANITLSGDFIEVIYGKIYFSEPLAAEFNDLIRLEIYSSNNRVDNELNYIAEVPLRYSTLAAVANPLDTSISVVDGDGFAKDDLLYIMNPNAEFRRASSVLLNDISLMNSIVASHAIGNGISKVGELGGFSFYDSSNNSTLYVRLKFPSNQTCSVQLDLLVRS